MIIIIFLSNVPAFLLNACEIIVSLDCDFTVTYDNFNLEMNVEDFNEVWDSSYALIRVNQDHTEN